MAGKLSQHLLSGARPPGALSLMYHAVGGQKRKGGWPWQVSLQDFRAHLDLLEHHGWRTVTIAELVSAGRPPAPLEVALTFDDGYVDNFDAFAELKRRGMRATWFVVTNSLGQLPAWNDVGRPVQRLLNVEELRAMHAQGMEIGSHSCSHQRLTALEQHELTHELVHSRMALEQVLGDTVTSFAFPYGSFDARTIAAVRGAGYTAACTTQSGWALLDGNPLSIRRLTVLAEDGPEVLARKLVLITNDASWRRMALYWGARARARFGR